MSAPLLQVENLKVHFPVTAGVFGRQSASVKAVDGVSFSIQPGGTLGLVGESGCGKSTVGRAILRLLDPTDGSVKFEGRDLTKLSQAELRGMRRHMQIVFQDPFASLNPRMTVMDIVGEALAVHGMASGAELEERVAALLQRVGISRAWLNRYPHEFSGGQRQRISIARAIALGPKLVVCDEAVSALDVSIQAQVINLLIELRRELNLAYLFISHDLAVVRHISDQVAVMYLGKLVETAPTAQLFQTPVHPYTRALLSAIPVPDPSKLRVRVPLVGDVPNPLNPPSGCHFHTRCPAAMERCRNEAPAVTQLPGGQQVSCFLAEGVSTDGDWYGEITRRTEAATAVPTKILPPAQHEGPAPPKRKHRAFGAGAAGPSGANATQPSRTPMIALAGLLVVGLLAGNSLLGSRNAQQRAETQLAQLHTAVEAVAAAQGRYPHSLRELGWRLPAILGDTSVVDPWGRPWRYQAPGSGGAPFDLGSTGADGEFGGGDDIGTIEAAPRSDS